MSSFIITAFTLSLAVCNAQSEELTIATKPKKKIVPECDLYLAPLKTQRANGFRTGIYAGRQFRQAELLEISSSVVMKSAMIEEWQVYDYSFETESRDHEMHLFGSAMMLPHREYGNVHHFWTADENSEVPSIPPNPYTDFDTVSFYAQTSIAPGEELLLTNGDAEIDLEEEEALLGIEYDDDSYASHSIEDLDRMGHCLSNVYVAESEIPEAGKGLFSNVFLKKGDIATISPLMVLPRHKVEKQNGNSLLINYCISQNTSDVALLPVGVAGMINHNDGINGDSPNVHMDWHSWDVPGGRSKVNWEIKPLEAAEFPPLYIKFLASRDIHAGEELTIDYGSDWEDAWHGYDEASRSVECPADRIEGHDDDEGTMEPQFRHFIGAPSGLFPSHFASTCIGKNKNDCPLLEAKRRMTLDDVLQDKFEHGPEHAAAYRQRIFNKERDSDTPAQNTCQKTKRQMPLVYSEINPPIRDTE